MMKIIVYFPFEWTFKQREAWLFLRNLNCTSRKYVQDDELGLRSIECTCYQLNCTSGIGVSMQKYDSKGEPIQHRWLPSHYTAKELAQGLGRHGRFEKE